MLFKVAKCSSSVLYGRSIRKAYLPLAFCSQKVADVFNLKWTQISQQKKMRSFVHVVLVPVYVLHLKLSFTQNICLQE